MQKIIHAHIYKNGFIRVFEIYQEFNIKEWEGYYFINEEPTEKRLKTIINESPLQINKFFLKHKGIAYIYSVTKTKPIEVSFKGTGPLKFNNTIIK